MEVRRVVLVAAALLIGVSAGQAQEQPLAETVQVGDCFQYKLEMKLDGEMRFNQDGKMVPRELKASATHSFLERVLVTPPTGLVEKTARVYEAARASISVGGDKTERTLRPERKLIVAQRSKDQALVYSPAGPLTRGELDLTSEHFDTLFLTGILPGKAVKPGDTWTLSNSVALAVCHLEGGLTEQKLVGKLEKVEGEKAYFTVSGTANGVEMGALVKMTIDARGTFDCKSRRLIALEWKQKDERDQGPVSPAMTAQTSVSLARQPVSQPASLSDVALVSVPDGFTPPASMTFLEYREPKGRYALVHHREWQLVAESGEHTVLRLMDKGDFLGQVTATPWTTAKKGEHLSPEEFKTAMHNTSGWRPEQELQSGVVPADDGRWIYRLSVLGQLDGLPVLQNFFLIAAPSGEQVVLTFTLSPKLADKFAARDLTLAASCEVPAKK
jgi:hypothetical protein